MLHLFLYKSYLQKINNSKKKKQYDTQFVVPSRKIILNPLNIRMQDYEFLCSLLTKMYCICLLKPSFSVIFIQPPGWIDSLQTQSPSRERGTVVKVSRDEQRHLGPGLPSLSAVQISALKRNLLQAHPNQHTASQCILISPSAGIPVCPYTAFKAAKGRNWK